MISEAYVSGRMKAIILTSVYNSYKNNAQIRYSKIRDVHEITVVNYANCLKIIGHRNMQTSSTEKLKLLAQRTIFLPSTLKPPFRNNSASCASRMQKHNFCHWILKTQHFTPLFKEKRLGEGNRFKSTDRFTENYSKGVKSTMLARLSPLNLPLLRST